MTDRKKIKAIKKRMRFEKPERMSAASILEHGLAVARGIKDCQVLSMCCISTKSKNGFVSEVSYTFCLSKDEKECPCAKKKCSKN